MFVLWFEIQIQKERQKAILYKRFIFSYTHLRRIGNSFGCFLNKFYSINPFFTWTECLFLGFFTGLARSYPAWRLILASSRDLTFVCQWNNVLFHISPPWTHFSFYYYCIMLCYICVHDAYLIRRPSSLYYIIRCASTNKKDVKIRGCICFY